MSALRDNLNSRFGGFLSHWRTDFLAGLSVSLVALPLSMGVALACGAPVMAGLISAIVGGVITTFIRSGHISINGPSPALITIVFSGIFALNNEDGSGGFSYVLAAIIIAGGIQIIFGLLKLGKYGNFFPSSVIQGILAAIGVIILSSQIHVGLGVDFVLRSSFENLMAIPSHLLNMNPFIAIIFFNSLFILFRHPHVKNRFIKYIPAALWVLLTAVPLFMLFMYLAEGDIHVFGNRHEINASYLIDLPNNFIDGFLSRPDFGKTGEASFWLLVLSIFLISTVESVLSAKAIDKLDPRQRKTNLNQDLAAMGISTVISGYLGGLPVITVISRSSVNINHGAKTRYSNLYYGLLILIFLFFLSDIIEMIPLSALAAILVYTGYKLASPKVFKDANLKGYEQLLILSATLFATMTTTLLWGVVIGVLFTLLIHLIRSSLPATLFAKYLFAPSFKLSKIDNHYYVKPKGVVNFTGVVRLEKSLRELPDNQQVIFDFSLARIVDLSVLEYVNEWGEDYVSERNGSFVILGLDDHLTTSDHPHSIHVLPPTKHRKLSKRQKEMEELCFEKNWNFDSSINWDISRLRENRFFTSRPIEYAKNNIKGSFDNGFYWELNDVTFDEGALSMAEVHHSTMLRIIFDHELPDFSVEHDRFFSRFIEFIDKDMSDLPKVMSIDKNLMVRADSEEAIKSLFTEEFQSFLLKEDEYHIECHDNIILIFKYLRTLTCDEIEEIIRFGEKLSNEFQKALNIPTLRP